MQECAIGQPVSDEKITLRIKPNEMEITGQSTLGDACESMNISKEGEQTTVSFNPRFILDPSLHISR